MSRFLFATFLLASTAWSQLAVPTPEVATALASAQSLYYEARFVESIAVLAPFDGAFQSQNGSTDDKIKIKVLLALDHIGLNDTGKARSLLDEVCTLDSNYTLSPGQFSSKVMTLFEEVKREHSESVCQTVCAELDSHLAAGDIASFLERMDSGAADCSCVKAAALDAAELSYKEGVESYQKDDLTDALEKLRITLKLHPEHELATRYLELTKSKLRLASDRIRLQWQQNFDAQEFAKATATYRQLQAANVDDTATTQLGEIQAEYRKFLSTLLEPWKQACQNGDVSAMAILRTQATEMLPEPGFGAEILDQMKCAHEKACVWMDASLAMTRLTTRVSPAIPPGLRKVVEASAPLTVYAQVSIGEDGKVRVIETQGIDPGIREAVRSAVEKWKFSAARIEDENRCVDTILPIVINR